MLLHQQLILGIAASLTFWALLRLVPLFRELLALMTFAVLILLVATGQSPRQLDPPSLFGPLSSYVVSYPLFFLGLVLATTAVLAVLYVSRLR